MGTYCIYTVKIVKGIMVIIMLTDSEAKRSKKFFEKAKDK
jgi:hypothetical protein